MSGQLRLEDLQSFEDSALASTDGTARPEQRRTPRTAFETVGTLHLNGVALAVTTIDMSAGGVSVNAPRQSGVGMEGELHFHLPPAAAQTPVIARVRIVHCFHIGDGTYRTGLEIVAVHAGSDALQSFLLTAGPSA